MEYIMSKCIMYDDIETCPLTNPNIHGCGPYCKEYVKRTPVGPSSVTKSDAIHPNHYKRYSVEVIDQMIAIYGTEAAAIHCELTAFTYRARLGYKDDIEQDLKKEKWYLDKCHELREVIKNDH